MSALHSVLFVIHILVGSAALVLFWIPMLSKKGQLNHVTYGHHYKTAMYAVAASGAFMAALVLVWPMAIKGDSIANAADPQRALFNVRLFSAFLLYLSVLSFTTTRHGINVLLVKGRRREMQRFDYLLPIWVLLIGGVACLYAGIAFKRTLLTVFGILGLAISASMLRYCLKGAVKRNEWVIEHIGSMIGSGIGAYTAFIAFGGRTLFSGLGSWQMVFWIAPGLLGGLAAHFIARRYAKQLGLARQPSVEL